jgi:hypothetical protein
MKRKLEEEEEEKKEFCHTKIITNNENSIVNNQKFVIEIDDDNDNNLEILYIRYPSTLYEVSSVEKIIKNENDSSKPKTYRVTINMRDPNQQAKFRADLLKHYKRCIITETKWPRLVEAAHIMPFKLVGSRLETGILLEKGVHSLWDSYDISINPNNWNVYLSTEALKHGNYSEYHNLSLDDDIIRLLKSGADKFLLLNHYDQFVEFEEQRKNGKKIKRTRVLKKNNIANDDAENIFKAKNISELEKIQLEQKSTRMDVEKWQITRFILREKYFLIYQNDQELLSKELINQLYSNNFFLSEQYRRNAYLCMSSKMVKTEQKNEKFKEVKLIDAPTFFIENKRLNEIKNYFTSKDKNMECFFKWINDDGIIEQDNSIYDICKTILIACKFDHFFHLKRKLKLVDIEKYYIEQIKSWPKLIPPDKIKKAYPNITEEEIKKLYSTFDLKFINEKFLVSAYGIYILTRGSGNCYLNWPSWIKYIDSYPYLIPIYDSSLKGIKYSKISYGQKIPSLF